MSSTKFVFFGRWKKQDRHKGLWLAETFSTPPLKLLYGIQKKIGRKISITSTKFVFFRPIGKITWPPRPLIGWDIFDFFSEIAERNSMTLDRKPDLNVLFQVCVFRADQKNKMTTLASDWRRQFRLLLWKDFNETWHDASSKRPLPSLCFWADRKNKMASDWRRHITLLWNRWTESTKLDRKQDLNVTDHVCVFRADRKNKIAAPPLICWGILDFSSETAERNSTKSDWKQDRNVLYQVCVFWANWDKNEIANKASDWLKHFRLLLWNCCSEIKTLDKKQDLNVLHQVCVYRADRKNKIAAPAPDWLRHFRLFVWLCWTEFNETWQKARYQRPLPSLCFSGRSENKIFVLAFDAVRYFQLLWNSWMESNKTWQEA